LISNSTCTAAQLVPLHGGVKPFGSHGGSFGAGVGGTFNGGFGSGGYGSGGGFSFGSGQSSRGGSVMGDYQMQAYQGLGQYTLNAVDPYLKSAWFQPLELHAIK
jgi:hypothetical protein